LLLEHDLTAPVVDRDPLSTASRIVFPGAPGYVAFSVAPVGARAMPGSTILKFTDPYEYQAAMGRSTDLKTVVTASGNYQSEAMFIDLRQVQLARVQIALPQIVRGVLQKNSCVVSFSAADNQAHLIVNGTEVPEAYIAFGGSGAEFVTNISADYRWNGIILTTEILSATSRALVGYEIAAPKVTQQIIRAPSPLLARLHNLHEAAAQLAATVPDILAHPEVSRAIEQEMLRVLIACLTDSATIKETRPNRQRVLERFHQVVEANQDEPLYISEVCASIGVAERTLLNVCSEYLGMSPHRYLWLRRMNLVRRALTLAEPTATTVTMIANDHGFGELGRFAVAYRTLYGESPSATLRRTPSGENCIRII
jgi:AraC-like DNA-binding protein